MEADGKLRKKREKVCVCVGHMTSENANSAGGKITTVLNHPITIGRALLRRLQKRRPAS